MNRIIVFRYATNPEVNQAASLALKPHWTEGNAALYATPLGVMSILLSESTPEAVFASLKRGNIGHHFTVTHVSDTDIPIKILSSTTGLSMEEHDSTKTKEELEAEYNSLLDKARDNGQASLTPKELKRLGYLSEIVS